jgi:DNA-binding NtrC family response regulator
MGTPVRLLIADDSAIIRRAICVLLQAQTDIAVCGEAGNYAELLKKFNASTTDVVLMDIRMPGEKLFTPATSKTIFTVRACWQCPSGMMKKPPTLQRATEPRNCWTKVSLALL